MEVPPGEIRVGVLFHLDGTEKTIYDYYYFFLKKNDLENESCNTVILRFNTVMEDTVVRFR